MLLKGRWNHFADGAIRPVLDAIVQTADGNWEKVTFLLDSGADRTVFDASLFYLLAPLALPEEQSLQLGGIGGEVESQFVQTALAFARDDGKQIKVNGTFAVFTKMASSDISILGRDVTNNFDVIYSYPQREVLLLAAPHTYSVQLPF
jgi:hypothetical protein